MKNNWRLWLGGAFSLLALTIVTTGWWGPEWGWIVAAGFSIAVFGAVLAWEGGRRRRPRQREEAVKVRRPRPTTPPPTAPVPVVPKVSRDPSDPGYLAQRMLEQGRYALLLRPQIAANLSPDQLDAASLALDQAMGIVPEGDVLLQSWRQGADADPTAGQRPRLVHVEAIYLDRYPVTNRQFQQFVDDGGYENMPLWDATIWPAVLDFVDQTGHPGPRFWSEGHYPTGLDDHPVVGVSWYEGAAYARWAGKRLPSDPEWVKAGCWPVVTQGTRPIQRRYPWGDMMDRELAHLWGSGREGTVSVYDVPGGVSVGGIYHLIGNVWEWTTSNFGVWDATARKIETFTPMKSLRGGAFDTYFETQATCQFQSGESPIRRKHNIGFRCALAMSDVIPIGLDNTQDHDEAMLASCGTAAGEERS